MIDVTHRGGKQLSFTTGEVKIYDAKCDAFQDSR
jgi:hypothetical protein